MSIVDFFEFRKADKSGNKFQVTISAKIPNPIGTIGIRERVALKRSFFSFICRSPSQQILIFAGNGMVSYYNTS